jgi:YggT family protein
MSFISSFITMLFQVLSIAILGRVLISWVDPQNNWPISRLLFEWTEPILAPIRSLMPRTMMFDFSPIIAMLLLQVLEAFILGIL